MHGRKDVPNLLVSLIYACESVSFFQIDTPSGLRTELHHSP
jgi:hypothetical protein